MEERKGLRSYKTIFAILYFLTSSFFEQSVCSQYSDAEVFKEMNPSAEKNNSLDSLKKLIPSFKDDTNKVLLLVRISNIYMWSYPDSALVYSLKGLQLSQKLSFEKGIIKVYHSMTQALAVKQDIPKALEVEFKALHLSEKLNDPIQNSLSSFWIGLIYLSSGDAQNALYYLHKLKPSDEVFLKNQELIFTHLGWAYIELNKLDSALFYIKKACDLEVKENNRWRGPYYWMATINARTGKYDDALDYYRKSTSLAFVKKDVIDDYTGMADVFQKNNMRDSSIFYAKKAINEAKEGPFFSSIIDAAKILAGLYRSQNNLDSAFKYQGLMLTANDSLFNQIRIREQQNLSFIDHLSKLEEADKRQQLENQVRTFVLIAGLLVFLLLGLILLFNNRQKQKANILLKQQKEKVESTLQELRNAQTQLIQSEKEKMLALYERELHELEAKALRAQMNPHFIFNCMNSIKSLIQKNEHEKAINYLTTFSKLIRTVFQNSNIREITLYDEIETCRLYTQLESMRFSNKFNYEFDIDEELDLKSVMVPALIIQPFIENAIWHGIMPKEDGGSLTVKVVKTDHTISCIVDDNGIGREISKQNKFLSKNPIYESKGEHLTQTRLDLDNLLNDRDATIKIIDKKNDFEESYGTTVILTFKEDYG